MSCKQDIATISSVLPNFKVLFNWLAKACELITNEDCLILEPYLRRNVLNKTSKLDVVFDLPEDNLS
jgi:hypothetical protein